MSPIEVRHSVRAQPVDLESGIEFRNGRADFVEDVRKVMNRTAVQAESALRHARYIYSTSAGDLRDRAPEFTAGMRNSVDWFAQRLGQRAACAVAVTRPSRRGIRAKLEPWIADVSVRLRELDARLGASENMRTACRRIEARLSRMEFEVYMGAAIALVALAILIHGIVT
jgi:hypothetical protein